MGYYGGLLSISKNYHTSFELDKAPDKTNNGLIELFKTLLETSYHCMDYWTHRNNSILEIRNAILLMLNSPVITYPYTMFYNNSIYSLLQDNDTGYKHKERYQSRIIYKRGLFPMFGLNGTQMILEWSRLND